jgi:hypothetical protein
MEKNMISIGKGWWRRLLLTGIYALGVFGILASGGSGSGSGSASSCGLVIQGIAPTTDASNDIWIGVLAKTDDGNVDSVVRLNEDGSELVSFVIGAGGIENAVRTVAIAADVTNKVYVGGDFSGGILRLDPDGTLDPDFLVGSGFNGRVTTIVPLANGKVYVGGFFTTYQGVNVSGLVRLNSDGSWDHDDFIAAGVSNVESIVLATDVTFDLYSGGQSPPWVERWNNNGFADTDFDPAVFPALSLASVPFRGNEIYVGGTFTGHIVRLNSNTGNTDGGFVVDSGFDADVLTLELTVADDIYVGGSFTTYQGVSANGIVRLNVNGSRDTNFNVGSGFTDPNDPSALSKVASLAQATDGTLDVYVGGGFSEYDGNASNGIARLKVDGSLNTGFAVRISVDGETCSNQTI